MRDLPIIKLKRIMFFSLMNKQKNIIKSITKLFVNLRKATGYSPKLAEVIFG